MIYLKVGRNVSNSASVKLVNDNNCFGFFRISGLLLLFSMSQMYVKERSNQLLYISSKFYICKYSFFKYSIKINE